MWPSRGYPIHPSVMFPSLSSLHLPYLLDQRQELPSGRSRMSVPVLLGSDHSSCPKALKRRPIWSRRKKEAEVNLIMMPVPSMCSPSFTSLGLTRSGSCDFSIAGDDSIATSAQIDGDITIVKSGGMRYVINVACEHKACPGRDG
jgi:hypothetical protein